MLSHLPQGHKKWDGEYPMIQPPMSLQSILYFELKRSTTNRRSTHRTSDYRQTPWIGNAACLTITRMEGQTLPNA